ncbi:MAG: ABC transporter permease subunit [Spirochaetota bacterium]
MPLVSTVGRKSAKVRLLLLALYLILIGGAITMVYPFLLMVTMSTTGNADSVEYRLLPRYWGSDAYLFKKYTLDLSPDCVYVSQGPYRTTPVFSELSVWFGKDHWFTSLDVEDNDLGPVMKTPEAYRKAMAADCEAFIANCPVEFKFPLFLRDSSSPYNLRSQYINWLMAKYGSVEKVNRAHGETYEQRDDIRFSPQNQHRRPDTNVMHMRDSLAFLATLTPNQVSLFSADGILYGYLQRTKLAVPASYRGVTNRYGQINKASISYDDLMAGKLGLDIRERFLRSAPTRFIRIDTVQAGDAWRTYLMKRRTAYFPLSERLPFIDAQMGVWNVFISKYCPSGALSLVRPETSFRDMLAKKYGSVEGVNKAYGTMYASMDEVRIPYAAYQYSWFLKNKGGMRWIYFAYNFKQGFNFIFLHGYSLMVTVIYIVLSILTALTVNPMAAYAMSRFRLKESHYILLFLLTTMAFPAEVLMIPNFLSVKSFPLIQILTVAVSVLFFIVLVQNLVKAKIRIPLWLAATVGLGVTIFLAGWLVPTIAKQYDVPLSVTLMNSFWALILPGLANGYGIFLLKGFFDAIPPEIYEAGLIDGANEVQLFMNVTLPLSRPILAVIALNAFTNAYGAFMHAFLTCQDPKMWTLMVFLYEYQQYASVPMLMASLVITSIPTLVIFLMAQKVILEGIVIPTFK